MSLGVGGGTGADDVADAFYPIYRRLFGEESDFVAGVETRLNQARMSDSAELYLSKALGLGIGVGALLWILGVLLGYLVFIVLGLFDTQSLLGLPLPSEALVDIVNAVKVPALVLVTGVVFGSVGFALGFGGLLAIPYMRASERKREINMLLPDAVAFMYALSIGGLNQLELLKAMAAAEDTYGEVSAEFSTIVQETTYFDTDYRNAVRNQSLETPSDDLAQFLTDMLSIINSGGDMTSFLADKKEKHMRTAKQQQEMTLETLELFGEMYMTLSLFPLLLIIILVIMGMLGQAQQTLLYGTVYALIPLIGVGFLVLVSTVKQDEPGDGYLQPASESAQPTSQPGLFDLGLVEEFDGGFAVFDRVKSREGTHETAKLLRRPHLFFRDNPLYVLLLTVPATLVVLGVTAAAGAVPTTFDGMVAEPVWSTFVLAYVPIYLNGVPLAVFREWNLHRRQRVIAKLSDNLRKLSSANNTGLTLLESVNTVAETSTGTLSREFEIMYAKVNYGMSLREALIEFNNKYHIPRLARTVKLISKAQEASSEITSVLSTAAQASENQDDIDRERKSRTRMQIVIIVMTYLTLLAVMAILKTQFLDVMSGLSSQAGGSGAGAGGGSGEGGLSLSEGIDTNTLSLLFFHAVTLQAILSGFISGYIRDAEIVSGVKYVVILSTIALLVWMVVG